MIMETEKSHSTSSKGTFSGGRVLPWVRLLLGIAAIYAAVFLVGPWIQTSVPQVATLHRFIQENDIDATALYYTEIDEFSVAEENIRHALAHR